MRTAEEIFDSFCKPNGELKLFKITQSELYAIILKSINEARKETIIECADLLNPENSERMKEEMLSLIKKLR